MKGRCEITEEVQNEDGSWNFVFDVDDEFKQWFKESQGLKRWSDKRFQKVIYEALVNAVKQDSFQRHSTDPDLINQDTEPYDEDD